jgi:hypothetical protein
VDAPDFEKGWLAFVDPAMTDDRWIAPTRLARALTLLAALAFVVSYVCIALLRIDYPFEIEWMEGGSRGHVARILSGEALYGPPTLAFTPFIYTPLYFQVTAWLVPVFGEGFLALRFVSWFASLGCFALVAAFVLGETRNRVAALLAMGVFAATYRISGAWFDIARVDSLFLLFTLAALFSLRFGRGGYAGVFAGALAACAFFTKQTALPIFGAFALILFVQRDAKWIGFFACFGALALIGGLVLNLASDGWFFYYAFELPGQHSARWNMVGQFWCRDVLGRLPVVSAAAIAFFALGRGRRSDSHWPFYACLALGTFAASMFSRVHSGGYVNVLMPAHAALAILFGLAVAFLAGHSPRQRRPWLPFAIYALCLVQFAMLRYDVRAQIPSEQDRLAGERVVEIIRSFEGEVLVPAHGYMPALAGKASSSQWMAIKDIRRGNAGPLAKRLDREIRAAVLSQRYAAIIVDARDWFPEELESAYQLREELFDDLATFRPRTGANMRPERLYVPRQPASP